MRRIRGHPAPLRFAVDKRPGRATVACPMRSQKQNNRPPRPFKQPSKGGWNPAGGFIPGAGPKPLKPAPRSDSRPQADASDSPPKPD